MDEVEEVSVLIVGAGPSGLAVAACLAGEGIEQDRVIILEREDCIAPLWHKRCYDRVRLHLAKQFCALPFAPHGDTSPKYIPAKAFADYVDAYAARFGLRPRLRRHVVSAVFDEADKLWRVVAEHYGECDRDQKMKFVRECYKARFLVVASGENDEIVVPKVDGMDSFPGEVLHSCEYKNGEKFAGKRVQSSVPATRGGRSPTICGKLEQVLPWSYVARFIWCVGRYGIGHIFSLKFYQFHGWILLFFSYAT